MREKLSRQMFEVVIQAAANGKVIARETLKVSPFHLLDPLGCASLYNLLLQKYYCQTESLSTAYSLSLTVSSLSQHHAAKLVPQSQWLKPWELISVLRDILSAQAFRKNVLAKCYGGDVSRCICVSLSLP